LIKDNEKSQKSIDELQQNENKYDNISVILKSINKQQQSNTYENNKINNKNIPTFTYETNEKEIITENKTQNKKNNKKQPVSDEYEFEYQAQDVLNSQESLVYKYTLKCILVFFVTGVLFWSDFSPFLKFIQPGITSYNSNPLNFIAINAGLLIVAGLICFNTAFKGIAGIFKLKSNNDSLVSLAFYGVLIYNLSLIAQPVLVQQGKFYVISIAASILLSFSMLGKLFNAMRAKNNFKLLMDNKSFKTAIKIDDKEKTLQLMRGLGYNDASISCPKKVIFLTNYLEKAYAESSFDKIARIFSPLIFVIALSGSFICYSLKHDSYASLLTFALICCIGAPITGELGASLPMWRSCKKLAKKNALLTGFETVASYSDINALVIDAKSIFPADTVKLKGIKAFNKQSVEEAIIDSASLVNAAGGTLSDIFLNIINGRTDMLNSVESFEYEDDLGLCGWVNNRRVLIGNRELMKRHNIEIPSRDYESKVISSGSNFVYLSVAGELCALLILEYECKKEIARSLKSLRKLDIILLITTNDSNITTRLLAEKFHFNIKNIKILHSNELEITKQDSVENRSPSSLAFMNGASSYASAVTACIKLHGSFAIASIFGIIGALLGVAFIIYTSLFVGAISITPIQLVAYQGIWALPVLLIAMFRKH
jgi:cation transport ATPase